MAWITKRGETKDGRGRYLIGYRDPAGKKRYRTVVGSEEARRVAREIDDALAKRP